MRTASILGLLALVAACEPLQKLDDMGGACVPAEVQAAFDRRCGPGCHTGGTISGELSLAAGDSADVIGRQAVGSPQPLVTTDYSTGVSDHDKVIQISTYVSLKKARILERKIKSFAKEKRVPMVVDIFN